MAAKRILAVMIGVLLLTAAPSAASTAPSPNEEPEPQSCEWRERFDATIADLGSDPGLWTVAEPGYDWAWAYTYAGGWVAVSPDVPCQLVADVVRHEWMHLQMVAMPGDQHPDELIADCGSWLLGSDYTPYIDRLAQYRQPCAGEVLTAAKQLSGESVGTRRGHSGPPRYSAPRATVPSRSTFAPRR